MKVQTNILLFLTVIILIPARGMAQDIDGLSEKEALKQLGMDSKTIERFSTPGYCRLDSKFSEGAPEKVTQMVKVVCKKEGKSCSFKDKLMCLQAQQIGVTERYDLPNLKEKPLGDRMYTFMYIYPIEAMLLRYAEVWERAIKEGWDYTAEIAMLARIAEVAHKDLVERKMSQFMEEIRAVKNEQRKELLIEMYRRIEELNEFALDPTGSLVNMGETINSNMQKAKDLRSKLRFFR